MEPFIPCSKIAKPSFDTFSSKLALAKMLNWQELDQIDHFAWGVGNKRRRASCVLDVSSDTYDTLRFCGDEVCFPFCFSELFIVEVLSQKQQFTIFLLQGIQAYIEGTSTQSVLDVFVFWQIRKHEHGLIHECLGAWRNDILDQGILQALQKLV